MGGIVAPEAALRYKFAGTILLGPVFPNEALTKNLEERIAKVQKSRNFRDSLGYCPSSITDLLFHFRRRHGCPSRHDPQSRDSTVVHAPPTRIHPHSAPRPNPRGLYCELQGNLQCLHPRLCEHQDAASAREWRRRRGLPAAKLAKNIRCVSAALVLSCLSHRLLTLCKDGAPRISICRYSRGQVTGTASRHPNRLAMPL